MGWLQPTQPLRVSPDGFATVSMAGRSRGWLRWSAAGAAALGGFQGDVVLSKDPPRPLRPPSAEPWVSTPCLRRSLLSAGGYIWHVVDIREPAQCRVLKAPEPMSKPWPFDEGLCRES